MNDLAAERRKRTLFYALPLGALTVAGFVGVTFWTYWLVRAPLVLIALSPLFRHIVIVSPSVDAAALYAVAVPRHFAPDPFCYFLGRDDGPAAIGWIEANSPSMGRFVRFLERVFAKVGPLALLVSPDLVVSTLAGAARVPFGLFVVFNVLGTIANVTVARLFGDALSRPIAAMVAFFEAHLLEVTAVGAAIVLLVNWWSSRKKAPAAPKPEPDA